MNGSVAFAKWNDDELRRALSITEEIVFKATGLGTYDQLTAKELRLRSILATAHVRIARKADKVLLSAVKKAGAGITEKKIASLVDRWAKSFKGYADDVIDDVQDVVAFAQHTGKTVTFQRAFGAPKETVVYVGPPYKDRTPVNEEDVKKATTPAPADYLKIVPSTQLEDLKAIEQITKGQKFWIGEYHSTVLDQQIRQVTSDIVLKQGLPTREAGIKLGEVLGYVNGYIPVKPKVTIPKGWSGSTLQYFDGVAANAATVSRIHGQMSAMMELGFDRYEVVNGLDERTCVRCEAINGDTLDVRKSFQQMVDVIGGPPGAIPDGHPWLSETDFMSKYKSSGAAGIQGLGAGYPPFHFRCFAPSTLVWTETGLKSIEKIKVGDRVLTHKGRYRRVNAVMSKPHKGEVIKVRGVVSTPDHPYLVSSEGKREFRAIKKGDFVAKVEKRKKILSRMRRKIRSHEARQTSHVRIKGVYVGHEKPRYSESLRRSESRRREGSLDVVPELWDRDVGLSGDQTGLAADVLVQMPRRVLECDGRRPEQHGNVWCEAGPILGRKKSDVWPFAGPLASRSREGNPFRESGSRASLSEKLLGIEGGGATRENGREVFARTEEIQAQTWADVCSGFLSSEIERVGRSEGLVSTGRSRRDQGVVSGNVDLDSRAGDEAFEFVPVGSIERWSFDGDVWNLTVEEDESYVVGEAGLVVHNCRCTIDIVPDSAFTTVPIPSTVKTPPGMVPKVPATAKAPKHDPARLSKAMSQANPTAANQAIIREEFNLLLAEEGGAASTDVALGRVNKGMIQVRQELGNALGKWDSSGRIQIRRDQWEKAQDFINKVVAEGKNVNAYSPEAKGFATVLHETFHGASLQADSAYRGLGKLLEEVATESATRHIMTRRFGLKWSNFEGYHSWMFRVEKAYDTAWAKAIEKAGGGIEYGSLGAKNVMGRVGIDMTKPLKAGAKKTKKSLFKTPAGQTTRYIKTAQKHVEDAMIFEFELAEVPATSEQVKKFTSAFGRELKKRLKEIY